MPLLDPALRYGARYRRAFRFLFWAFPFQLDLRINELDVLPDALGYAILLTGLRTLLPLHSDAAWAFGLSMVLVFLGIPSILETGEGLEDPVLWAKAAATGLLVVVVWKLCGIVHDLARHVGAPDVARQARIRREIYAGVFVGLGLVPAAAALFAVDFRLDVQHARANSVTLLVLVLGVLVLVAVVLALLMELMKMAERLCRGGEPEPIFAKPAPIVEATPAPHRA